MGAAQRAVARALAKHPHKDGRQWMLLSVVGDGNATAISQGTSTTTEKVIDPVVQSINEKEALYIGPNIRQGDIRLILPGSLIINEQSILTCDNETVDILKIVPSYQFGEVQEYKVYVRRRPEEQGAS